MGHGNTRFGVVAILIATGILIASCSGDHPVASERHVDHVGEASQPLTGVWWDCVVGGYHGFDQSSMAQAIANAKTMCNDDACGATMCNVTAASAATCKQVSGRTCALFRCTGNGATGANADEFQAYAADFQACQAVNGVGCHCGGIPSGAVVCDCETQQTGTPCGQCLNGYADCNDACRSLGFGPSGTCQFPNSTDPSQCCSCTLFPTPACSGCAGHYSCNEKCESANSGDQGRCAFPTSQDPRRCCACSYDGCQNCLPAGSQDCNQACLAAGLGNIGTCAVPGSTDVNHCCSCSWTQCAGCLNGYADCPAACHAAGHVSGYCAEPTSGDVTKCCGCTD